VSAHTESPWRWDRERDQILGANGSVICKLATGEDRKEEDANARLIAGSPALLATCKRVLKAIHWGVTDDRMSDEQQAALLKAAIEKAE